MSQLQLESTQLLARSCSHAAAAGEHAAARTFHSQCASGGLQQDALQQHDLNDQVIFVGTFHKEVQDGLFLAVLVEHVLAFIGLEVQTKGSGPGTLQKSLHSAIAQLWNSKWQPSGKKKEGTATVRTPASVWFEKHVLEKESRCLSGTALSLPLLWPRPARLTSPLLYTFSRC